MAGLGILEHERMGKRQQGERDMLRRVRGSEQAALYEGIDAGERQLAIVNENSLEGGQQPGELLPAFLGVVHVGGCIGRCGSKEGRRGGEGRRRRRRRWRRGEGGKRAGAGEVSVVQASCKCLNGLGNNESNTKCAVCLGSDRVHRLDFPFPNRCLVREAAAARVPFTASREEKGPVFDSTLRVWELSGYRTAPEVISDCDCFRSTLVHFNYLILHLFYKQQLVPNYY